MNMNLSKGSKVTISLVEVTKVWSYCYRLIQVQINFYTVIAQPCLTAFICLISPNKVP